MEQVVTQLIDFASNYQVCASVLMVLGGLVFFATMLKGAVLAIVAMTPNKKDDVLASKFYTFLDSTSIYFQPAIDLFRKKFGL